MMITCPPTTVEAAAAATDTQRRSRGYQRNGAYTTAVPAAAYAGCLPGI